MRVKKYMSVIFASLILLSIWTTSVFALFFRTVAARADIQFAENNETSSSVLTTGDFSAPGDTKTLSFTVENTRGTIPISYSLNLSAIGQLCPAVFLTLDSRFIGSLSALSASDIANTTYYLAPGESVTHTLEFELHIGAGSYFTVTNSRSCDITVSASATSVDVSDIVFVSSGTQLKKLSRESQAGLMTQSVIVLSSDVTVTEQNLQFSIPDNKEVMLELNGHTLTLSGNMSVAGLLLLQNSRSGGTVSGGYVSLSDTGTSALTQNYLVPDVQKNAGVGMRNNETRDLMGIYKYYDIPVTASSELGGNKISGYTATAQLITKNASLTIGTYTIPVAVIGTSDEAQVDALEQQYLQYILPDEGQSDAYISFDLFLPERFKESDCRVDWWSSNPDTITAYGVFTPQLTQQQATLVATYTLSNKVITRSYPLVIRGQSAMERLNFLIARVNAIELDEVEVPKNLPTPQNYTDWTQKGLNITSISYSMSGEYEDFLSISDNSSIRLTRSTVYTFALISITVEFSDYPGTSVTGSLPVLITLKDPVELSQMIQYVSQFSKSNTFFSVMTAQEKKYYLDFPMSFQDSPINYYIPNCTDADSGQSTVLSVTSSPPNGKTVISGVEKNYTVTTEGSLAQAGLYGSGEIKEYVNGQNAYDAVSGTVVWVNPLTGTEAGSQLSEDYEPFFRLTLNPAYLKTYDQQLYIVAYMKEDPDRVSPNARCALPVTLPAAIHSDNDGFPTAGVFEYVRNYVESVVPRSTGNGYILLDCVKNENVDTLNFSSFSNLTSADFAGLKYFTMLKNLTITNSTAQGQTLLATISRLSRLESLGLDNCSITNIEPLRSLTNLSVLDLSSNASLNNVSAISSLAGVLSQLDLRSSGIAGDYITYNEWAMAYSFFKRLDVDPVDGCKIRLAATGYYTPSYWSESDTVLREYKRLVYAAARITDIGTVIGKYVWLPRQFVEQDVSAFSWSAVSGLVIDTNLTYITEIPNSTASPTTGTLTNTLQFKITAAENATAVGRLTISGNSTGNAPTTAAGLAVECKRCFFVKYSPNGG